MSPTRSCGDVLMFPMGMSGHVNPMMYVAKGLMRHGITVTMVLEENVESLVKKADIVGGFNLQLVNSFGHGGHGRGHGENGRGHGRRGRGNGGHGRGNGGPGRGGMLVKEGEIVVQGEDGVEGESGVEGGVSGLSKSTRSMGSDVFLNELLEEQKSGAQGPKCIIADQFMGWTKSWADKLEIPFYVAIASPATFAYIMYNHSSLVAHGLLDDKEKDPIIDLPGIPLLHLSDLPTGARINPSSLMSSGDTFGEAAGLLFNTFYELEQPAIDAFKAQLKAQSTQGKGPKLLPIGPMLPPEFFSEETFEETVKESECIQWLNTRPKCSVIYIAFGSMTYLSPHQILELAHGLEASQVSFLWILRVQSSAEKVDLSTLLPPGFQEHTNDRGFVYSEFAPQLQILSHSATGGFLTHCGWNSSLESICRGVPMVGWPMGAEQRLCCRVLVDEVKVATEIKVGLAGKDDLVDRAYVESALRHLMTDPEGKTLRDRVLDIQRYARAARAPGGSSEMNFIWLVSSIKGSNHKILQAQ